MTKDQKRIIELQARLKLANDALGKIVQGCRDPEGVAADALYDQMIYEPKQLQAAVDAANKGEIEQMLERNDDHRKTMRRLRMAAGRRY